MLNSLLTFAAVRPAVLLGCLTLARSSNMAALSVTCSLTPDTSTSRSTALSLSSLPTQGDYSLKVKKYRSEDSNFNLSGK